MSVLRFTDVWFAYPAVSVLRGVSLAIAAGERVALLGRNGAGKTTLTKLAVALLHPDRGSAEVAGRDTRRLAPEDLAGTAAYLFQHPDQQLFARTLLAEVAFGPLQQGVRRAVALEAARAALARVGLASLAERHPYDLAPGQRKLLTLAAAIVQEPRLLVLDEPTQGLDRARVSLVESVVRDMVAAGAAVLGVSHDVGFVAEAFDRAVVLAGGGVAYDGPVAALVRDVARLRALDLAVPPAAALAQRLRLAGAPVRAGEVARALESRCRGVP